MTTRWSFSAAFCAAALLMPCAASAQAGEFHVSASLKTEHVAGLGIEYRAAGSMALLGRVEGLGRNYAAAAGIRLIPFRSDTGVEAYGLGMAGVMGCRPIIFHGCRQKGRSLGLAGGAGVSFVLSERWSAGIETVYWYSPNYDPTAVESGQDDRLTVGGVFRLRL